MMPCDDFTPRLVKAELSSNYLEPGQALWLTTWWTNEGGPARREIMGFLDIGFGTQRIVETEPKSYRVNWQPFPGPQTWRHVETWATTCAWRIPAQGVWGGTYRLHVGFCDGQGVPVVCVDAAGAQCPRIAVGEVDVTWSWGKAALRRVSHPVVMEFPPAEAPAPTELEQQDAGPQPMLPGTAYPLPEGFALDFAVECSVRHVGCDVVYHSFEPTFLLEYAALQKEGSAYRRGAVLKRDGQAVAGWELVATQREETLSLSLDNVWEADGYELLEMRLPTLLQLSGEGASLVDFFGNGRLVPVACTRPMVVEHTYDVRNAAALCAPGAVAVLELPGLDDRLLVSVAENRDGRRGVLGAVLTHRLRAWGAMRSIAVLRPASLTIDFARGAEAALGWQAAARILRRGLPGPINRLYERTALYKIIISYGPDPDGLVVNEDSPNALTRLLEVNTFDHAEDIVRRAHHLTGGCRQIVYLVGFQKEGHDSGYPDVLSTHPRAGTPERLRQLIRDGQKYRAVISLHDNFDDVYESLVLDPRIVAVDSDGEPFRLWFWASGMSYAVSPGKYADLGLMQKRIRDTVEFFGLHTSDHLDVLTSEVRRYDYDPDCPRASDASLLGNLALLREFNRCGIDITSENLSHPFVGRIGLALWTRYQRNVLFPAEQIIPLVPMVYHGAIQYCCSGTSKTELIAGMLQGAVHSWADVYDLSPDNIRAFYVQTLPMGLLYGRTIDAVEDQGETRTLRFGPNSYVTGNLETLRYEIAVDGRVVSRDWATFAPGFRDGQWLAYTAVGGALDFAAPADWTDGVSLEARLLTPDGEGVAMPCAIEGGRLILTLPAAQPAVVRRINNDRAE